MLEKRKTSGASSAAAASSKTSVNIGSMAEIFSMDPELLLLELSTRVPSHIPISIDTVEDMAEAGKLLGKYASWYSYLMSMSLAAKLKKRALKQEKADKKEIEDALSREEVFSSYADIVKASYNAISRMFTVKQQINDELKMTDGR